MTEAIRIITTGGTIDKIYFDALSEFQVGEPTAPAILHEAHVTVPYTVESVCRKDSLDLTDADRAHILDAVKRAPETRIIITHGTDTMINTARQLHDLAGKVIVFTGAMSPTALRITDAHFNMGAAVIAAQTLSPGIYVVMNGRILDPEKTVKNRALHRFEERHHAPAKA